MKILILLSILFCCSNSQAEIEHIVIVGQRYPQSQAINLDQLNQSSTSSIDGAPVYSEPGSTGSAPTAENLSQKSQAKKDELSEKAIEKLYKVLKTFSNIFSNNFHWESETTSRVFNEDGQLIKEDTTRTCASLNNPTACTKMSFIHVNNQLIIVFQPMQRYEKEDGSYGLYTWTEGADYIFINASNGDWLELWMWVVSDGAEEVSLKYPCKKDDTFYEHGESIWLPSIENGSSRWECSYAELVRQTEQADTICNDGYEYSEGGSCVPAKCDGYTHGTDELVEVTSCQSSHQTRIYRVCEYGTWQSRYDTVACSSSGQVVRPGGSNPGEVVGPFDPDAG